MSHPVFCLSWEHVCDQCSEIRQKHQEASDEAEYGINFYEFINTEEGLSFLAKSWFDNLPDDEKRRLLNERFQNLKDQLEELKESAKEAGFPLEN